MESFSTYLFRKAYKKIHKLGDRLAKIELLIDWGAFTPIIQPLYDNQGPQGGRPNIDPVVMVKLLMLQAWYGLSDPELERQTLNRIDFQHFLGRWRWARQAPSSWQRRFRRCWVPSYGRWE